MGEKEDLAHLAGFSTGVLGGRVPFFPDGDDHEPQQHGVGDAQDRIDEAGNVVLLQTPSPRLEALHQHEPADREHHGQADQKEANDDAHPEPPSRAASRACRRRRRYYLLTQEAKISIVSSRTMVVNSRTSETPLHPLG